MHSLIINSLIAPGRKIRGESPVQSMIVDSTPTWHGPPSKTKSSLVRYLPISSTTAVALVGETWPKRLALGAAKG